MIEAFRSRNIQIALFTLGMLIAGCQSVISKSLDDTSVKPFAVINFDAVHQPIVIDQEVNPEQSGEPAVIFGNPSISTPPATVPANVSAILGRWEGYSLGLPVDKDHKAVLMITEISKTDGKLYYWSGTNLQYPDLIAEVHFWVANDQPATISWQYTQPGKDTVVNSFSYDSNKNQLSGVSFVKGREGQATQYILTRDRTMLVYKDYSAYLAGKRIYTKTYQDSRLSQYGSGYMVYLPDGYEDQPEKQWPLIYFLHGSGDRGDNVFLLAKASPFMYIREKGPLSAIIVAPLNNADSNIQPFNNDYMDGVMAEILSTYRVDQKRIYGTGLSLGGAAIYQMALHKPDLFAAILPISACYPGATSKMMATIKSLPVWAIQGENDPIFPPSVGQVPVNALKEAGGNAKFTVLIGADHDTWTKTYSDPTTYGWLFAQEKQ
jgi:predicted esterase